MRTAGIISEYNPFHRGHAWQIGELRRRLGAGDRRRLRHERQLSSGAILRSVMRTHARAGAVRGGAGLVLELPLPWAIASAEGFAAGGALAATGRGGTRGAQRMRRHGNAKAAAAAAPRIASLQESGLCRGARSRRTQAAGEKAAVPRSQTTLLGVEYCGHRASKML